MQYWAAYFDTFSKTDDEGQLYGLVLANGKRWLEQRKFFSQYLAGSKDQFDEVIGDEVSRFCNEVSGTVMMPYFHTSSNPILSVFQMSSKVGSKGKVIEINTMFMYSVNSVLWRLITGRPIEPETASRITFIVREAFRVTERSSILDILQVKEEE